MPTTGLNRKQSIDSRYLGVNPQKEIFSLPQSVKPNGSRSKTTFQRSARVTIIGGEAGP